MKRSIALLLSLFLLLLAACGQGTKDTTAEPSDDTSTTTAPASLADYLSAPSGSYKTEDKTYEEDGVEVTYPYLTGYEDVETETAINDLILEHVKQLVKDSKVDDVKNLTNIHYEVSLLNDAVVSIIFQGEGNFEMAAHPWAIFRPMTIDVAAKEQFKILDFYDMNQEFLDKLLDNPKSPEEEATTEAIKFIKEDSTEALDALSQIDAAGGQATFYLTKDSLGVSLPTIHALGDFVLFEIPV